MKRYNCAKVMAAAGAVLSSISLFNNQVQASSYSWSASPGSNVLNTAANWLPAVDPGINDDAFFGLSSQTSLSLTANQSFNSITFNANAPAYTLGDPAGTASILLGNTNNPATGGTITNNSSNTQTVNTPMAFRTGDIVATNADIVFNGSTFNIGNNSNNNAGRNVTVDGAHNVTINNQLTGTPTVSTTTPNDGSTNFGQLIKNGAGTLFLTNNSNNQLFTGRITVNAGALQASVPNAFGANGTAVVSGTTITLGTTHVSGGTNTGRVELVGNTTFAPETLVLEGRTVTNTQLLNVSGNNTWTGPINLDVGASPGTYSIQSDFGQLTISGNVTNVTKTTSVRNLVLRGSSNGVISGNIVEGAGASSLSPFKDGTGVWTFTGSNTYTGITTVNQGILQIGAGGTSGQLGTGSVIVNAGATLAFNRSDSITVANNISGAGNVAIQSGSAAFSTGGFNGPALILNDGATLTVNSSTPPATLTSAGLTVGGANGSTLNFSLGTGGNPINPVISAAGLTRNGNNVVNIQGSNLSIGTITLIQNTGAEGGTGAFSLGSLPNRVLANLFDTGSKIDLDVTGIDFPKWTGALNNTWDTSVNSAPKDWVLNSDGTTPTDYLEGDSVLFDDSSSVNNVNIPNNVSPNAVSVNNSSHDYTFTGGGGIVGGATLTKTGTGVLTLANDGNNTFSGTISIGAGGTLSVGGGTTSGSLGGGTLINNGNLVLNRQNGAALANQIMGSGNIYVRANSIGTLTGNNSYDGTVTIEPGAVLAPNSPTALGSTVGSTIVQSGGALYVGSAGTFSYAEPVTVSGTGNAMVAGAIHFTGSGVSTTFTGTITLAAAASIVTEGSSASTAVFSGVIGGANDLTVDGGGTVIFSGNSNSYANTIVNAGTLVIGNGGANGSLGTGSVNVVAGAALAVNRSDAFTLASVISGDGIVVSNGNGTLSLTGANTFTGTIAMNRGVLSVTPASVQGLGTANKVVTALNRNAGITLDGNVTLPSNITLSLSNDGDLTQAGATVPFAVRSTTGTTNTINGNIGLTTGGGAALLSVDAGGTLIINGTIALQGGVAARPINLGGAGTGIVNGVISNGPGGEVTQIAIAGTGAPNWILTNANTCTGTVALQSGTLTLMNSQALGLTSGTFAFIGNGAASFSGVAAALNIGTDGLTVPNNLWTNKDGASAGSFENSERTIGYSGATGEGTFSGGLDINGGVVFRSNPNTTLVMSGVLEDGTDKSAGVRRDVFVNAGGSILFTNNETYDGFTEVDSGTLTIASTSSIVSSPTINVSAGGTLNAIGTLSSAAVINTNGAVNFGGTTGGTALARNIGTLNIGTGAIASITPSAFPFTPTTLMLPNGAINFADPTAKLDITNNAVESQATLSTLVAEIASGQLKSSSTGGAIGYNDLGGGLVEARYTVVGDTDLNGITDTTDFNALAANFNKTGQFWFNGDLNGDGVVNASDFALLAANYGKQLLTAPPGSAPSLGTLVPEPASMVSIIGMSLLVGRRRRK